METTINEIQVSYTSKFLSSDPISTSNEAFRYVFKIWNRDTIDLFEEFKVLYLNKSNMVIGYYSLGKGGIDFCSVDVRLLLSVALTTNSTGFIIVHNHPSGKLMPSEADKKITKQIQDCCKIMNLVLLDHLIISSSGYFSFMDECMI